MLPAKLRLPITPKKAIGTTLHRRVPRAATTSVLGAANEGRCAAADAVEQPTICGIAVHLDPARTDRAMIRR